MIALYYVSPAHRAATTIYPRILASYKPEA